VTPSHTAGQASAEYVALISLVGVALAGAGAVAGAPALGSRVVHAVRTGVCVVAGDVCRHADAVAAGLAPCTLSERTRGHGATLTVLSLRIGEQREWVLARRSDGSYLVSRSTDRDLGVSGGYGVESAAIGLRVGLEGSLAFSVATGRAWELPDAAAARRFMAAVADGSAGDERRWPPTWRFGDAGEEASGGLGLAAGQEVATADVAGVEASLDAALGVRTGRGTRTLYFRGEVGDLELAAGGRGLVRLARGAGPVLVEYTRGADGPLELGFRVAEPGAARGEVVETVARLDLRVPANRAVAARLLRVRAPWPPSVRADLRAVVRQAVLAGVVERSVYAVREDSASLGGAARMGAELGLELERSAVERRLVSAEAWTAGQGPRERVDCKAPPDA